MSQIDVWKAGGPSNSVMTGLEGGAARSVSAKTLAKLDAALQWEPGSARRVYEDGGEPTEVAAPGASESAPLFPGGTAGIHRKLDETATSLWAPGTALGDLSDTNRAMMDRLHQLATINGLVGAIENPEHPHALTVIRASFRENIGKTGPTPDVVRAAAASRLPDIIEALNEQRRGQLVEYAYRLLDEQDAEDGGGADELAARRDSNTSGGGPIRDVVDDDDPTAGIDPQRYATHPKTDDIDVDNWD